MLPKRRYPALLIAILLTLALPRIGNSATSETVLTQRDWMINLVEALDLSFGLPDAPQDSDYLRLLQGSRIVRVEAEASHQPDDKVSVKEFRTFGPFSGAGWVSGIGTPTVARLRFHLPRGGTYRLTAAVRLPGHHLRLGDKAFTADGENNFTPVEFGEALLRSGPQEVQITLPPNGGIDYLELTAPPLPAIEPVEGWHPDLPLTLDVMAETVSRIHGFEALLPHRGNPLRIEAETSVAAGMVDISKATHLGLPSGSRWVRAGARPTTVELLFTPPAAGVYDLSLQGTAEVPVVASINGSADLTVSLPPLLGERSLGTHTLPARENRLRIGLPPRAGIDFLLLQPCSASGGEYRRLTGLPAQGDRPTSEQVDALLALLAALGPAD